LPGKAIDSGPALLLGPVTSVTAAPVAASRWL